MKTLVLANQKGGVGKTAVATLVAHFLAQQGRRVLAVDFDHQGNFSSVLRRSRRPYVSEITADRVMTQRVTVSGAPFLLVPADRELLMLERQREQHSPFANNFRAFLRSVDHQFDACIVDTNPNPDIRLISALASADHVLAPIQLTMEAMEGIYGLLNHDRVGVRKVKALLNPKLELIGILPMMVEATPFQRANLVEVVNRYMPLLIRLSDDRADVAKMPRRTAIAEAQADGAVLWEVRKTAARDSWKEIARTVHKLADILSPGVPEALELKPLASA